MIQRIVAGAARRPWMVLGVTLLLAMGSAFAWRTLSRDVIPDLSDPQIGLVAEWMDHPATEVATRVTEVLTRALDGVPGSTAVRGSSMGGMAYVDVVFDSTSALEPGRREIAARVERAQATLPANVRVTIGPEASSTGWVFQYALIPPDEHGGPMPMLEAQTQKPSPLVPLRRFQEDVLKPALAAIPGVAEVTTVGGENDQVLIETTPDQLDGIGVAFSDVMDAVRGVLKSTPRPTLAQIRDVSVGAQPGTGEHRLGDVARIRIAPEMAGGMADVNGMRSVVAGIVIARRDADIGLLVRQAKQILERERPRLPNGTKLGLIYDRSELAGRVEHTLLRAVAEEIAVVVFVVLLFLAHFRTALVPMITLPLVVLFTFAGMKILGVPATVMSLGGIAIALGMAVDADLVALEACHRRLETDDGGDRRTAMLAAASSFGPAILTSLLIAALAFLPVFAFGGETGRLLRPLALTKTLVVLAAAVTTLTLSPALRDRLLRGRIVPELGNPVTRTLVAGYRPFVHFALSHPAITLVTAGLAAASAVPIVSRLGSEFLPRIDEGDLLFMPTTAPGVTAMDAAGELARQDSALAKRPEVSLVFGKVGRADSATDPAPFSMAETAVRLEPRDHWPKIKRARWYSQWAPLPLKRMLGSVWPEEAPASTRELVESLDRDAHLPGWVDAWTAPIRARMDMMSTGVRTPVGVRIAAADPARLDELGAIVEGAVRHLPETTSSIYESLGGETRLAFVPDREALARHGIDPERARATADFLLTGGQIGELRGTTRAALEASSAASQGTTQTAALVRTNTGPDPERSFRVRLSLAPLWLAEPKTEEDLLRGATVRGGGEHGQSVPLTLLGRPVYEKVPAMLRAERGQRVGYVYVDVADGTDLVGFVDRARGEVEHAVSSSARPLTAGESLEWTGQYDLIAAGRRRLWLIAPLVVAAMFALLVLQFRSVTEALIVLTSVPFALVGSFWTLYLLDYRLSAPVWVGLLSVIGLAMQTGVVMVVYIDEAFHRRVREGKLNTREDIIAAHAEGTVRRLRPKIMTISTMAAGLLPLLWSDGAGSEIMRRVAAPMIGGLLTSAFLTLEVIPVLYTIWRTRQLARGKLPTGPQPHFRG